MSKGYLEISGVTGNSFDAAHQNWIELFNLEVQVNSQRQAKVVHAANPRYIPVSIHARSIHGPYADVLHKAWMSHQVFPSAVIDVVYLIKDRSVVKKRLQLTSVQVTSYLLIRDPGLVKPIVQFILSPEYHVYQVGSAVVQPFEHEHLHAVGSH